MYSNATNLPRSMSSGSAIGSTPSNALINASASCASGSSALTHWICDDNRWLVGPAGVWACQVMPLVANSRKALSRTSGSRLWAAYGAGRQKGYMPCGLPARREAAGARPPFNRGARGEGGGGGGGGDGGCGSTPLLVRAGEARRGGGAA